MLVHRVAKGLIIHSPAKLNLFLEVLAKRNDGYHEIETLMCPINLFDTLIFQDLSGGRIQFRFRQATRAQKPHEDKITLVPDGADNLVVKAVELVRRRLGITRGSRIGLIKRIPAGAGLGGGSSDAAAALWAANHVWELGLSESELAGMAAELGSDVPFFLSHGPAICRGRGEKIVPVAWPGKLPFVVVCPAEGLSTAAVYNHCCPAGESARPLLPLLTALQSGRWWEVGRGIWNRLLQTAKELLPFLTKIEKELRELGCLGYGLSGSGAAYFGLCRHARHARYCAKRLQAKGFNALIALQSCH